MVLNFLLDDILNKKVKVYLVRYFYYFGFWPWPQELIKEVKNLLQAAKSKFFSHVVALPWNTGPHFNLFSIYLFCL